MPDSQNYNTRLRTNSLILPPRRLRPSPSPPPRHRLSKNRNAQLSSLPQPQFPPPNVVLHPDDATNKTFLAIGRALLAIENRAITIKDLSHLTLDYGLLCQNASAASQAITTFIRNHLNRCHQERSQPLLLSLPLTGTSADDRLALALHSRSGGTSSVKDLSRSLTSFRRGTTVWYLSDSAGAPCPFRRAGLSIQDITNPAAKGIKRKRESYHAQPRKFSTPGPAMATRHRTVPDPTPATNTATAATTSRLRVKLTLKPRDLHPPSPSISSSDSSQSDLTDVESLSDLDATSQTDRSYLSHDNLTIDSRSSDSDLESSIQVDASDSLPISSLQLPPYPILSPSIPSPSCSTPATSLASPSCSDPFASYRSALCSGHFMKSSFSSFRTALSNPPPDHRARSSSLPFSAASPPPDSEDEDDDYHNSMIGLRRGSAPIRMKQEENEEEVAVHKYEPVVPRYVSVSVHGPARAWDLDHSSPLKQEPSQEDVSTPLEVLPGFVSFSPASESVAHVLVKDEPTSAVLPPDKVGYGWGRVSIKPEPLKEQEEAVLDPEDERRGLESSRTDIREDPVRIDTVVQDVEVLGPESVISREWDAAWSSGLNVDVRTDNSMDVDAAITLPRSCTPLSDADVFVRRNDADLRASPAVTLLTASTSISSPPSNDPTTVDSDHEAPILMHPLRSCDPPVVATVIEGIPVYHTLLAPDVSFLRRIDTSFVNLTPLMTILGLPLSALVSYTHATPRMMVSRAPEPVGGTWVPLAVAQGVTRHAGAGKIPPSLLDVFLSVDLGMWFPDALGRLMQLHANAGAVSMRPENVPTAVREVGIRVEDVFVGAGCVEFKQDARLKPDIFELQPSPVRLGEGVLSQGSSLFFEQPRSACASISMPIPLNEQEESLFHSFVDMLGTGVSTSSSPLSSAPSSPIVKPAVTSAVTVIPSSANEKENSARSENAPPPPAAAVVRRKREKAAVPEVPVRRSKRALAKVSAPMTRSRTRTSSEGRVVG